MKLNSNDVEAARVAASPEFCDAKGLRLLFGISRAHGYVLIKEGKIRSISIRRPGAVRGRRLFNCASIRAFLNECDKDGETRVEVA